MNQDLPGILRGFRGLRRKGFALPVVFCLAQVGCVSAALAQVGVSAQEYQRQQERERALRRQQERAPDVRLPAQAPTPSGQVLEEDFDHALSDETAAGSVMTQPNLLTSSS